MLGIDGRRERWVWLVALVAAVVAVVVLVVDGGGSRRAAAATPVSGDAVTVSGVGVVQGVPDTLTASFDVHVTRSTVQSALDAESAAVHRVLTALQKQHVAGRAVQTASLQLSQHYDNHGRIAGYDVFEVVTARVTPLRGAGAAISAAATSAGNNVGVDGLSFDIANDDSLLSAARTKAYDDAKARAEQYARLTGRSLGTVEKVSEVVATSEPMPQRYGDALAGAASAAKALPIRAGEQPVTVTVTVVWRLT